MNACGTIVTREMYLIGKHLERRDDSFFRAIMKAIDRDRLSDHTGRDAFHRPSKAILLDHREGKGWLLNRDKEGLLTRR